MEKNKMKKNLRALIVILIFSAAAQIAILRSYHPVWWDEAVYSGMGKFIFSAGKSGIWEPLRPPILPLMLGFLWKSGIELVSAGRILSVIFSLGTIVLAFLIAKKIFGEKTAVIAAFLTAFSHLFLFYSHTGLSEIPSVFFGMLAVLLLLNKKYLWSGAVAGISFLTKFPSGVIFGASIIFLVFFCSGKKIENAKKAGVLCLGFLIPLAFYLMMNTAMYGSPMLPFSEGQSAIEYTFPKGPFWFYIKGILAEGIVCAFAIFYALTMIFRKDNNTSCNEKTLLWIIAGMLLLYFSFLGYKEMRFALLFIPYIYILSAAGIFAALNNKKPMLIIVVLIAFALQSAYGIMIYQNRWEAKSPNIAMQNFYSSISGKSGEIWVSDPLFSLYTDAKLHLMYYPTFDKASREMNLENASFVLLNTCDLVCRTEECEKRKSGLINQLENSFKKSETNSSSCRLLVFSR